ncbi:MAG: hypothetical protein ACLFN7_05800 [Candidatus Acetothermia bacterium]
MRKDLIPGFILILGLLLLTLPPSSAATGQEMNTEEAEGTGGYPRYGFGAQFISPSGGLSSRIWLNPRFGLEGNAILWSNQHIGLSGTTSVRSLYRLTEDSRVDFYLAGGGAYNFGFFSDSGEFSVVGTGGISVDVFSEAFVLNLEFGMQAQSIEQFGMTFGSGFHYYF